MNPVNIFRQAEYEIISSDTEILFQSKPQASHSVVRFLEERDGDPIDIEVGNITAEGTVSITGGVDLDDDELLTFGDDDDFSIRYDSSRDELVIEDETDDQIKQTFDKVGDVFFPNGAVHIEEDNTPLFLGQGDDASIQYDGNNLVVNPQNVGSGVLDVTAGGINLSGNDAISYGEDGGVITALEMSVTGTPGAGTEQSYSFDIDGTTLFKAFAEADGVGGIQNESMKAERAIQSPSNINYNDLRSAS